MSGNHPSELSPRQRMINMMYLVLTALLALNVSKEVLNSFFEVNLGLVKTTESLDTGSDYGNTSLSGDVLGVGLHHQTDSGFFGRIEYLSTDIGGTTLTSTTNAANTVTLDNMDGETLQLSFGKAF